MLPFHPDDLFHHHCPLPPDLPAPRCIPFQPVSIYDPFLGIPCAVSAARSSVNTPESTVDFNYTSHATLYCRNLRYSEVDCASFGEPFLQPDHGILLCNYRVFVSGQ